jgi:hypothetical protein
MRSVEGGRSSGTMLGNKSNKALYTAASPPLRKPEPKLNDVFGRVEQAPTVTIARTPHEALTFTHEEKERSREGSSEHSDSRRSPTRTFPVKVQSFISCLIKRGLCGPPMEPAFPALPLPPFDPILLSAIPSLPIDPKKTIITLETSTESFKTTMATLISYERCHFTGYFSKISTAARKKQHSEASSVYLQSSGIEENLDSIDSIFVNQPTITASFFSPPDARTWRFRCRIMAGVSLITYIPFIVLVSIYAH